MFPVYGVGDAHPGARASRPHPYLSFLWLALSLRPVLKVANLSPATSTAEPKRPPAQFRVNPSGGEGQGCAGPCTGGAPALTGGSLGAARADPNFAKGSVYWCSFVFIRVHSWFAVPLRGYLCALVDNALNRFQASLGPAPRDERIIRERNRGPGWPTGSTERFRFPSTSRFVCLGRPSCVFVDNSFLGLIYQRT